MSLLDWLTAPALVPWAGAHLMHRRLRTDLRERFGMWSPPVSPGAVWVCCASVGEVRAAEALIQEIDGPVLWTADTDTGAVVAREIARRWPNVVAMRRPVDHGFTLGPAWSQCRPRLVVFVEGAWWPSLAAHATRDGVAIARVSARPGRGTGRWLALGASGDLIVAQSQEAADWFRARCRTTVVVGGNLKASGSSLPTGTLQWPSPFAVAASTRPGDELACLDSDYEGKWLLAPRHLDRIPEVEALLRARQVPYVLRSQIERRVPAASRVVLLDNMGELPSLFRGAEFAFIGGTFDASIGGHSPLEAARAGVPVVSGPHTASQGSAFDQADGITVLAEHLSEGFARAREQCPRYSHDDAARRTMDALRPHLGPPAPARSPRPWARPLTPIYRTLERAHRGSWSWRQTTRVGVPVVSIGSANLRSPGRTSTVHWMAGELAARGYTPGIATRGYRRTEGGLGASWKGHGWQRLGDEGAMLAHHGWLVAAHPNRVEAARALEAHGATAIILDDGLQRRDLCRDLDLVVVDGHFPNARGWFPAGDARERAVPERADGVIYHHKRPVGAVGALAIRSPGHWQRNGAFTDLPKGPLAAFAGVGQPAEFFASLPPGVRCRVLADHQNISRELEESLVAWADGASLVCTAKDYARLPESMRRMVWYRDIVLDVTQVPDQWFSVFPKC